MQKVIVTTLLIIQLPLLVTALAEASTKRPGVQPLAGGRCPANYPIKGNFTTHSGERCIYHLPGQRFYSKTKAERCYANEVDAAIDGCRKSKV
jgi:hypothetical protein